MIPAIKSEMRKVFSLRSTYFILLFILLLTVFLAFYIEGIKFTQEVASIAPDKLSNVVTTVIAFSSVLGSFVAILLSTHEYRYNTIAYTLTSAKNRTQVLASKAIVVSFLAVISAIIFGVLALLLVKLGLQIKGITLIDQVFPLWSILWKGVFVSWGFAMLGLLLGIAFRLQTAVIAIFLLMPSTIEPLLGLLLKEKAAYLPFSSLGSVITPSNPEAIASPAKFALIFICYLLAGWAITWFLFLKRDAN